MDLPSHVRAEPIPGYRLLERLGRGGYGEVWKAEAPGGMHKAIKFVFGDLDGVGGDAVAAEQEFKSLNRVKSIRHPFLLSLERIEVVDGQLIIVMELADRNLWDRYSECADGGLPGIPRPELLRYMEEAAEALDLMNLEHQIQHLDIKPQNVFLVHRHVKVADFGLAKDIDGGRAALTGGITPMYAPPETFEGWVSRQSDQYSLAIVFMEMLTGRRPFNGSNTRQLILQHMSAAPDLSGLSSPDREAVARALSKKPADRFPTCADFVRALHGDLPVEPAPPVPDVHAEFTPPADLAVCQTELAVRPRSKTLPALVTPKAKASGIFTPPLRRGSRAKARAETPVAPPAPVERTGDGVLVPALVIGLGGTGLAMMRALRGLIGDRFGRARLPHLRWLYVDTDPATAAVALSGPGGQALAADEVLLARLRRPTHYLSRDGLPAVDGWLPPETLFRMSRDPATEGVRGIGRLALCDHYHVICHRVRAALERFLDPAVLDEAERLTKLGLRSGFPRVYVAASLTGGTGSGMLLDMTYLVRREVRRLGFGEPYVVGLLGVPGDNPEGQPPAGLANARAALVELQHYGRPGVPFETVFDTREGPVSDPDRPFRRAALVALPLIADEAAPDTASALAAQVMFRDLLTAVGRTAYPDGSPPSAHPLTAIGIQRVVWPRTTVVKTAGWLLAKQTLAGWTGKLGPDADFALAAALDAAWPDHLLGPASLRDQLVSHLVASLSLSPDERIAEALAPAGEGDHRGPDMEGVRAAFRQLVGLLGRPGPEEREHPHEVGQALADRVRELAGQADARLQAAVLGVVEQPGLRVAGADDAIRLLRVRLTEELARADREAAGIEERALGLFIPLHHLLTTPGEAAGDAALELMREWAGVRVRALVARAGASVYRALLGGLPEYVRELGLIRARLADIQKQLDTVAPDGPADDGLCRPVFPDGAASVTEAATRLVDGLTADDRRAFETAVQAAIRVECQGVAAVCGRREGTLPFLVLLTDQAIKFMDARCPRGTPADLMSLLAPGREDMREQVAGLLAAATPTGLGHGPPTLTVLAVPGDAGPLVDVARDLCPGHAFHVAPSPDDLVVWRECRGLTVQHLPHLSSVVSELPAAADAVAPPSAYARLDVAWGAPAAGEG